jgi:poly-gamma-glutamate synthesis protein (capsule biosynthesis protein)
MYIDKRRLIWFAAIAIAALIAPIRALHSARTGDGAYARTESDVQAGVGAGARTELGEQAGDGARDAADEKRGAALAAAKPAQSGGASPPATTADGGAMDGAAADDANTDALARGYAQPETPPGKFGQPGEAAHSDTPPDGYAPASDAAGDATPMGMSPMGAPPETPYAEVGATETAAPGTAPSRQPASATGADQRQARAQPATPAPISLTISAVGDCTIGFDDSFGHANRFDQVYRDSGYDPKYFFGNVADILGSDDLTIANLETTFTTASKKADKAYRFKGDPSYVRILEEGSVEAVNVANNHMYDYLQQGYEDTLATLGQSSVAYFGYDTYLVMNVKGIRVGLAGFHIGSGGWSGRKKAIEGAIGALRESADLVVVSFHWGIEGKYAPTGDQTSLARFCAYNGADLVLGHHPHTLQGVETVNGKAIAYSLGNFCFGGNRNPKDKDTMIFQQTFEFDAGTKRLEGSSEPKIIPVSLSSVTSRNDYRPTPLEGDEAARVLQKIQKLSDGIPPP